MHETILIYFYGETRTMSRKWFTSIRIPRDREMTLEVLHDPEKWSSWKLTPLFGLINIRFYVPHLTYLHVSGISADNHNGNIECERKKAVPDSIKTHQNLFSEEIKITERSIVIGLRLCLDFSH